MSHRRLCDALEARGVECVFGLPGTQTVELFEALRTSSIRVVLATKETSAAFMANGYARASGRPGVVLTIGGPGFAWALPGIAEARLDSVPLVHLVTAPATGPGRAFQLQRIDQEAIAGPILKACWTVGPDADPAAVLEAAFAEAAGGEPGPVMVQLAPTGGARRSTPEELGRQDGGDRAPDPAESPGRAGAGRREAEAGDGAEGAEGGGLDEAVRRFGEARRPLLLLGQGSLDGSDAARALAELGIPVLTTPSARGVVPEDHPRAMPFDVLRGGTAAANELLAAADLVVGVGCKLGHNGSAGFQLRIPPDRFVHVDSSPAVLGANYPAALEVVADGPATLERLRHAREGTAREEAEAGWPQDELEGFRARLLTPPDAPEPVVHGPDRATPAAFFADLRRVLPDDALLVTDTGLHQILTRRHFQVRSPRGLLFPSDFQSMGFGLPAAVGAALAGTGRPVVALLGDGGFLMVGMELVTAVREGLPLLAIVFNDGRLNQIRMDQLGRHGHESAVELGALDLAGFCEAAGVEHRTLRDVGTGEIPELLARRAPVVLEVGVGDSWAVRSAAARARAKGTVRRALGPRLIGWLKGLR